MRVLFLLFGYRCGRLLAGAKQAPSQRCESSKLHWNRRRWSSFGTFDDPPFSLRATLEWADSVSSPNFTAIGEDGGFEALAVFEMALVARAENAAVVVVVVVDTLSPPSCPCHCVFHLLQLLYCQHRWLAFSALAYFRTSSSPALHLDHDETTSRPIGQHSPPPAAPVQRYYLLSTRLHYRSHLWSNT